MSGVIRIERAGPLAFLVVENTARRNALNAAMWRAIPGLVAELEAEASVRVVIIRGAGEQAFVSGADISEFSALRTGAAAQQYDSENVQAFEALCALSKPLIAMVHGFCVGGGVALSICCDLRYTADDGVFAVPAGRLGLGYPLLAAQMLLERLGDAHAKELFFTARRFSAAEALRLGLVNEVFAKAELETRVRALALGIAENAPLTLTAFKRAAQARRSESDRLGPAQAAIGACFHSDDYREGVQAFLEKRAPRFSGR